MASVSSVSSSSSSIYGNRNVISGLASGMDTESMIENAVSGYKTKISTLQQKRTKVEWQQEVYRSIIGKMSSFSDKYTSYASSTNLLSSGFFNQAVKVTATGKYADMVSASGKTSSSVQILGVKQLARAATYTVSGIGGKTADKPEFTGSAVDLSVKKELSNVSGSLTIKYGGDRSFTLDFGELDIYQNAEELAKAIQSKLGEQTMTLSDGTSVKVSEKIDVKVNDEGNIEFSEKGGAGNAVTISGATGKIKDTLKITADGTESTLNTKNVELVDKSSTLGDYLSGKELTLTLDGVTKKITLPEYKKDGTALSNDAYTTALQTKINEAFGAGKVALEKVGAADGKSFSLKFSTTQAGSTLSVSGDAAKALGLDKAATYVNTSKTLDELLGDKAVDWSKFEKVKAEGDVKPVNKKDGSGVDYYTDSKGNRVKSEDGGKTYYRVDDKGEFLREFKINGKLVGAFNKDTALETVLTSINSNADAGVKVSYSKTTNQFQFTTRETGASSRIDMGDGLANALFGGGKKDEGKDAIFSMMVNGQELDGISRSSNTFDVDGMSVSLKGTFGAYGSSNTLGKDNIEAAKADAVSFTSSSDADKIVDTIKSMVEDYNAMVTEIKNAYSTMPQQKSNGNYYEPLTEEDKADMSESSIKAYEEKAKQGLLFADRDLSALYSQLTSAISMSGKDGADLKSIGITSNYSNGLTTLSLNEEKLRAALETDPDKVRDVFSKSMASGSSSNGLMQALKSPLDMYSKTQGTKGILVQKAGSTLAPSTLYKNTLQNKLDDIDTQIEKWQDKMADQVDRYTSKFTALEKLISQMNSQSSALASFLGSNG
ncbi:flagellar filament capping protein FliD [Lawsonibacter sp. DFI.6.74]|nr:flagellar filament capping protein FliD [Lawsonibacter sp. DFI.6.74]MCG4773482.1 flagellar filament capping protein FliD [Lawsonibacter sp. DFI.5.51]